MRTIWKKVSRELTLLVMFFLPAEKKIALERRLRGKEEFRKLQLADVVVVSFGKSGRTWLRVMMSRFYQLRHGLSERHLIGFDNLNRRNSEIPKIFFTHDNYLKDFTGNADNKRDYDDSKVVLLIRNPKDVAVSQFFQWKFRMRDNKKKINAYPVNDDMEVYDFVVDPESGLPKIVDYLNLWAQEAPRIRELLVVRYEDLRSDTAGTLRRIVDFIGTPGTDEQIDGAVEFSSVENMRKMEQKKVFWLSGSRMVPKDRSNPNSYKVRKAKVGGYKDYFDDQQIATVDAIVDDSLDPMFGYTDKPAADSSGAA